MELQRFAGGSSWLCGFDYHDVSVSLVDVSGVPDILGELSRACFFYVQTVSSRTCGFEKEEGTVSQMPSW